MLNDGVKSRAQQQRAPIQIPQPGLFLSRHTLTGTQRHRLDLIFVGCKIAGNACAAAPSSQQILPCCAACPNRSDYRVCCGLTWPGATYVVSNVVCLVLCLWLCCCWIILPTVCPFYERFLPIVTPKQRQKNLPRWQRPPDPGLILKKQSWGLEEVPAAERKSHTQKKRNRIRDRSSARRNEVDCPVCPLRNGEE